jgi:hypothetical protein
VIPSYAQCNHCNAIHKIIDICSSEILRKDELASLETVNELKYGIPKKLAEELERINVPLYIWQEINFIFQNESWKDGVQNVVIASEVIDDETTGKYISIRGAETFFINKFSRKELISV